MSQGRAVSESTYDHDRDYAALRHAIQQTFDASSGPLFHTDASGLYQDYLEYLPSDRQVHTCSACHHFIEDYGDLVRVADDGSLRPAMWRPDLAPDFYFVVVAALHNKVRRARITRPFLSGSPTLGQPKTGDWGHFAIHNVPVFRHSLLTPNQAAAAKVEDYRTVATALVDFTPKMLDEALRILEGGHLIRAERFVAPVGWLRSLHDLPKGRAGENLFWRTIATAPDGFCHPRASVIGPLLEDIQAGLPFSDIKAKFDARVAPLVYQRPQAAPSEGNIKAAEAIFDKMGLAPALERRFARLDECVTVWVPLAADTPKTGPGVFGHLTPKGASIPSGLTLPPLTMTWVKFMATVLPTARSIEMKVPHHGNFTALLTAANPDAPPILKWDREDRRNPVSWYVYNMGSPARQWGLTTGSWVKVTGVVPSPATWGDDPKAYLGGNFVLVLDKAMDSRSDSGNALFPEILRGELHAIRSVIEAYSRRAQIGARDEASACGYALGGTHLDVSLRVTTAGGTQSYLIDRID